MLDDDLIDLARRVGFALQERGKMVVTAESCTGGLVAAALTETAGSSNWFERGFATYSNAAKQDALGVSAATLRAHGAVSEATAGEMAAGALKHSRAQIALAITGIAGPGGGLPGKPVGTVCFGWAVADRVEAMIETTTRHFTGDRAAVRRQSVAFALEGVLARL